MNYSIHRYGRIPSTNETAKMLAQDGAEEGTVVTAESQSSGKGRHGREWVSPPDTGLYLSIIFKPDIPIADSWQFGYLIAVAAAESIHEISGMDARIKWPNDIMLNGRKTGGILIETDYGSGKRHSSIIAGIGINVNTIDFPNGLADKATSLAVESSKEFEVDNMESCLLSSVSKWYEVYKDDNFTKILDRWHYLGCTIGNAISVNTPDGLVEGKAIGISETGELIIEKSDLSQVAISAGDVISKK